MMEVDTPLGVLRRQIDDIDAAMHDLLMRRAVIADEVLQAKGSGLAWRPAREARVLRRLLERHQGVFPPRVVAQIWREIVSAMTRLQGDFSIAVYAPAGDRTGREAARNHFGCDAAVEEFGASRAVLDTVEDGSAAVGVLPGPEPGGDAGWWDLLADSGNPGVAICAELPFVRTAHAGGRIFCVATIAPEESGDDRSLIALHTGPGTGRGEIEAATTSAGLTLLEVRESGTTSGPGRYFVEFAGFVPSGDERLGSLVRAGGEPAKAIDHLGVWPAPLALPAPVNRSNA